MNLRRPRLILSVALSLLALTTLNPVPSAGGDPMSKADVQAAFLYNFAKFVEWPPDAFLHADSPFTLCIIGDNPFNQQVKSIFQGKTIQSKPLLVKTLSSQDSISGCHELFISSSEKKNALQLLQTLKATPVLTVSELDQFSEHGGMIGFIMEQHRVRFTINQRAAEKANLKISSDLLKLAKVIE